MRTPNPRKFEPFVDVGTRQDNKPQISIAAERGQLSFSTNFNKKYGLSEIDFARLSYYTDKTYHYIAVVFSGDKNTPGALKIHHPREHFGTITSLAFFKKYGLNNPKFSKKYDVEVQVEDGINYYIVKLPYETS